MIPKTEIRCSLIYNRLFNKKFSKKDYFKLIKDSEKFEKLYNKHIKKILQLIEKYHSKKWKRDFIPIYIVKEAPYSFSDPLTLIYKKDEKYMLVVLAHELLHNNSFGKKKIKDRKNLHIYMEPINNKVVESLNIDLKKELYLFNERIKKHYNIK